MIFITVCRGKARYAKDGLSFCFTQMPLKGICVKQRQRGQFAY